jgi:hypothetical protein
MTGYYVYRIEFGVKSYLQANGSWSGPDLYLTTNWLTAQMKAVAHNAEVEEEELHFV